VQVVRLLDIRSDRALLDFGGRVATHYDNLAGFHVLCDVAVQWLIAFVHARLFVAGNRHPTANKY
jgi:hypothetical protein